MIGVAPSRRFLPVPEWQNWHYASLSAGELTMHVRVHVPSPASKGTSVSPHEATTNVHFIFPYGCSCWRSIGRNSSIPREFTGLSTQPTGTRRKKTTHAPVDS